MSIHISSALVLSGQVEGVSTNAGIIGYQSVVNFDSVSATSELQNSPITNLANPATSFSWEATSNATQTITINTEGREIDYIGIARHNLAQVGLTVEVKFNGVTVLPSRPVSDNQALLFLFNLATPTTVELIIAGATDAPTIAVLYAGRSIKLQRNIYVGHTPITYGRNRTSINGISENGQYLGEIVVSETASTSIDLQNLTPDWYRNILDPFFAQKPRRPCFWAWRPATYADEVRYCWVEGNPQPVNQRSNGMMSINWQFRGIV